MPLSDTKTSLPHSDPHPRKRPRKRPRSYPRNRAYGGVVGEWGRRAWLGLASRPLWQQAVLAGVFCVLLALWFGRAWLGRGLPAGDLPGSAAQLARWQAILSSGELTAAWIGDCFFGHPRALMNLSTGQALAYAPFLLFGSALTAVKVGAVVYLGLNGVGAFVLARKLTGYGLLALAMAVLYALHPIHLSTAVSGAHAGFPPFYCVAPWLAIVLMGMLRHPTEWRAGSLALLIALAGWLDLERTAVLAPGLLVFALVYLAYQSAMERSRETLKRSGIAIGAFLGAGALALGLLGWLLVPAWAVAASQPLFDQGTREGSIQFFSLQNPLAYLDPAGAWLKPLYQQLPGSMANEAKSKYLAITPLVLAIAGVFLSERRVRPWLLAAVTATGLTLAAAHGPFSGYGALDTIFDRILLREAARNAAGPTLLAVTGLLVVAAALLIMACRRFTRRRPGQAGWLALALGLPLAILLLTRPYAWFFKHLPLYGEMRNPSWFATAMPTLGLLIAGSLGASALMKWIPHRWGRWLLMLVIGLGIAAEVGPYRAAFDNQRPAAATTELKTIAKQIEQTGKPGRVMTFSSYNPQGDLLHAYSDRASGFYWLNWQAPPRTKQFMLSKVYPKLVNPETIDQALKRAGNGHIRYLIRDLSRRGETPKTEALTEVWRGEHFALYENHKCQPLVRLDRNANAEKSKSQRLGSDIDHLKRPEPGQMQIKTSNNEPQRLVLAESWTPRWQATVNGEPASLDPAQGPFMGVKLPSGANEVTLQYQRPAAYPYGVALSAIAGLTVIAMPLAPRLGWPAAITRHRQKTQQTTETER